MRRGIDVGVVGKSKAWSQKGLLVSSWIEQMRMIENYVQTFRRWCLNGGWDEVVMYKISRGERANKEMKG